MARKKLIYGAKEEVILGQDSELACICMNPDGQSWRIIRLDEEADIRVNSEDLHLVHYLTVNDRIDINGETWHFAIPKAEDNGGSAAGYVRFKRLAVISAMSVAILAVLIFCVSYRIISRMPIHRDDISAYENSICKFSVVQLIYQQVNIERDTTIIETLASYEPGNDSYAGTGFFCTDGSFVTARHCVEPWITANPVEAYDRKDVSWAMEAETFNAYEAESDSTYRRVIAKCEIYNNRREIIHTFLTDTCMFSIGNDLVYNIRGRLDPMLWRSLGTVNRASSLGDIAAVRTGLAGRVDLASDDIMNSLKAERQVAHFGYEGASSEPRFISSKLEYSPRRQNGKIIRCLEHECTEMVHGFSGSPAIIRHRGRYYAIGIVSKTHDRSTSTFFSVPVTELENLKRRWTE